MPEPKLDRLFTSMFEVAPLPGQTLFDGAEGAFGRGYVMAPSLRQSLSMFEAAIHEIGGEIVEYHWVVNDAEAEWENPDSVEAAESIAMAQATGEVAFASFHTWAGESD